VLVRTMSAPASMKRRCSSAIFSGFETFHSSGASPEVRPMSNRLVPVAPSASRTPFSAISFRRSGTGNSHLSRPRRADLSPEDHSPVAVEDNPVLEMAFDRARQHLTLDVAAHGDEVGNRHRMIDAADALLDDRPLVKVRGDVVRC